MDHKVLYGWLSWYDTEEAMFAVEYFAYSSFFYKSLDTNSLS